ncbi:hypothetical protein DDN69_18970 [Vibrio cholerae]|nr:hypothetical protein [Vibrio cholerae]
MSLAPDIHGLNNDYKSHKSSTLHIHINFYWQMYMIYKFANIYWNTELNIGYDCLENAVKNENAKIVATGNIGKLISVLCQSYPRFISNTELKQRIWNHEFLTDVSVTQLIKRTRDIIGDTNKLLIVNTKGKGYRLNFVATEETFDSKDLNNSKSSEIGCIEISKNMEVHSQRVFNHSVLALLIANTAYNIWHYISL